MYCKKCGIELKDYNYCPYCGFPLKEIENSYRSPTESPKGHKLLTFSIIGLFLFFPLGIYAWWKSGKELHHYPDDSQLRTARILGAICLLPIVLFTLLFTLQLMLIISLIVIKVLPGL